MKTVYYRKRNIIRSPDGDEKFDYVNEAKRKSRELQQANGGIGCGVLRVVTKFPKLENNNA